MDKNNQKKQAISVIEIALDKATKKGAFKLGEVSSIIQALTIIKQDVEV